MSIDKKALGKGLASLISDSTIAMMRNKEHKTSDGEILNPDGAVVKLSLEEIEPNHSQPRRSIAEEELYELSRSIAKHGILQPILVKQISAHSYQIIAGERRWRAAKLAQISTIPAIVKTADEQTLFEIAIIENIQRENLKPIEEAEAYKKLMIEFDYTQEDLASRLGKSRAYVANTLRLLNLPNQVKEMLMEGRLSAGHARAVMSSKNPIALATEVVQRQLTVRETENMAKQRVIVKIDQHIDNNALDLEKYFALETSDSDIKQIESSIKEALSMDVKIISDKESQYIILKYKDLFVMDKLLALLNL